MYEFCLLETHLPSIWLLLEEGVRGGHFTISMIFSNHQRTLDSSSSILFFVDIYYKFTVFIVNEYRRGN